MYSLRRPFFAILGTALSALGAGSSAAGQASQVEAVLETEAFFDDAAANNADADDPAIWVHPTDPERSLVISTLKEGGVVIFDLNGRTLQRIAAPPPPREDDRPGRFNNVDLLLGFPTEQGKKIDLAVVTDRGLDKLKLYAIDPQWDLPGHVPVTEVTSATDAPLVFSNDQDEVNQQTTAYGLAVGRETRSRSYVGYVSRRERTAIAKVRFFPAGDTAVGYRLVGTLDLPREFTLPNGAIWTPCQDEDGPEPQVEGMVVDEENRVLYAGQEQVGIWKIPLQNFVVSEAKLIDSVRTFGVPYDRTFDAGEEEYACEYRFDQDPGFGGQHLEADVEGLTIYRAGPVGGYLLASSQGDDSFAVYQRRGSNRYLGSFQIVDSAATDGVQESDGAMVVNASLGPLYPLGLFVTQDGHNTPEVLDSEDQPRANTNFKFVPWENIARSFVKPLKIKPNR